jgi:amino acid adenylation domain-containing protein
LSEHLCNYLEASARQFPDRVASVDADGTVVTYRELEERASRIGGFLKERGVRPGDRVGLVLPKSTAALVALFGVMKAGAAYVPVDYSGPAERTRSILADCGVRAVFADQLRPELAGIADTVVLVGAGPDNEYAGSHGSVVWNVALRHGPLEVDFAARRADDLAYILYTSGSTGVPKGVMLTHQNATSYVDWCSSVFCPRENDRFSSHAPFHFDLSILDIYLPIKHGASVHLIPDELGKNPRELAAFIADRQLTVWYSTPAILGFLAEFGQLGRHDYSSLRLVLFAGEVFPVKQLRRLVKQWPSPVYYNLYGPTETNVCTFAQVPTPIPDERTEPFPIGWPCSHCEALVLNSEKQPVASAEEGLLYISGPSLFRGYWQRRTETAAAFFERDGVRWYNTGDVVKQDRADGFVYVGRHDRMVKRRGYRIELNEIEACLYRHPAISGAAVVALPHPDSGMRIISYLVAASASPPSVVQMKAFCNQHLPAYMNPDFFIFIDALPRTSTDKTDYQGLIKKFESEMSSSAMRATSES